MQSVSSARIQFGSDIDSGLERAGAIAQAVDPHTIHVSSRLLSLPASCQRMILLHELAHLQQLASPGSDSVASLESEAWQAAEAWSQDRHYQIRGRARGVLNALALVQGGDKGHPHAPIWYAKSPVEPISAKATITVKSVVTQEVMTLESLLDGMLAGKGEMDIVVVCHGSGGGLALPLMKGATAGAQSEVILALSADKPGEEVSFDGSKMKTPAISEESLQTLTRLSLHQVQSLRTKMNSVRALKLKHVAFRACSMGINKDTMQAFRALFGAASVSAPKEFDSYGVMTPNVDPSPARWAETRRKQGFHITVEGNVAYGTKDSGDNFKYAIGIAGTTKDVIKAWTKKHIVEDGWGPNGIIYHAIKVLHPLSRTSPSVHFIKDTEFIQSLVNVGS
jgi:hypothetical protein